MAIATLQVGKESVRLVGEGVESVTTVVQNINNLVTATEELGSNVVSAVDKSLAAIQKAKDEEIKHSYQLKTTVWRDILSLTVIVSALFDKINDLLFYCKNEAMATARNELGQNPPNLQPLRELIRHLKKMSKPVQDKQSELRGTCNTVMVECKDAAEDCAKKERESRNKKTVTRGLGGAGSAAVVGVTGATGAAVVGSIILGIALGPLTLGVSTVLLPTIAVGAVGVGGLVAAVGGGIITHKIAQYFKESEASFKNLRAVFDSLLTSLRALEDEVALFQSSLENIATQVANVKRNTKKQKSIALIKDSLECLSVACEKCDTVLKSRDLVERKAKELKATLDERLRAT